MVEGIEMTHDWLFRPISLFPTEKREIEKKTSEPGLRALIESNVRQIQQRTTIVFEQVSHLLEDDDLELDFDPDDPDEEMDEDEDDDDST